MKKTRPHRFAKRGRAKAHRRLEPADVIGNHFFKEIRKLVYGIISKELINGGDRIMENIKEQIDNLVDRIKVFDAKEIILFGSYATGTANEDSDIDLCIITDQNNKRKIDLMRELRRAIAPVLEFPVDLLVYSKDEFYERANISSSFEFKIQKEGVKIYEQ